MIFKDEVNISVSSGKGGDGCVSFRREKFIPEGGPDGGDGGDGGDIVFQVSSNLNTLANFHEGQKFKAKNGADGMGRKKFGRKGDNLILQVPPGTIIYEILEDGSSRFLADLSSEQQHYTVAHGGRGGKGNVHFKSSVKQSPQYAQKGKPSIRKSLRLELKLIAHIGFAGFPNAGKSSLIARLTNARPKVADYPFTTLVPNLGIMVPDSFEDGLIIADIPGLIQGAHAGKGLGLEFLKHIERTKLLLFVLDITDDPRQKFAVLRHELSLYSEELASRPFAVCLNKIDLMPEFSEEIVCFIDELKDQDIMIYTVSAATGQGLEEMKKSLYGLWKSLPNTDIVQDHDFDDFTQGLDL